MQETKSVAGGSTCLACQYSSLEIRPGGARMGHAMGMLRRRLSSGRGPVSLLTQLGTDPQEECRLAQPSFYVKMGIPDHQWTCPRILALPNGPTGTPSLFAPALPTLPWVPTMDLCTGPLGGTKYVGSAGKRQEIDEALLTLLVKIGATPSHSLCVLSPSTPPFTITLHRPPPRLLACHPPSHTWPLHKDQLRLESDQSRRRLLMTTETPFPSQFAFASFDTPCEKSHCSDRPRCGVQLAPR